MGICQHLLPLHSWDGGELRDLVFPIVRFIASDDWIHLTPPFSGRVFSAIGFIQCLVLYWGVENTKAFFAQRSVTRGEVPLNETETEYDFRALATLICGPMFANVAYSWILVVGVPMLAVLADWGPVSQSQTITEVDDGGGRRSCDAIRFAGSHWLVGGIIESPTKILDAARVGDTIRLNGKGNRWGVFYSEVELIRRE